MNKKIKVLIAAVVVLFLGLGIYTFASPNDEEDLLTPQTEQKAKKVDDKDIDVTPQEETEEETEEEDNEQVINVPGRNNNQGQNNPGQNNNEQNLPQGDTEAVETKEEEAKEVDTTAYDAAVELVKVAEKNLTKEDLDAAKEAVSKVTELDVTELEERLVKVGNDITTRGLVNELANLVKEAKSKDDIKEANKYNTSKEVEEKVALVNNTELKKELSSKMESLIKVLSDNKKPVINIADKLLTNEDVIITVEDTTNTIILLNKEEVDNNTKVEKDGKYTVLVTDEAFNETEVTFEIDTKVPTVTTQSSSIGKDGVYSKIDFEVSDESGVPKIVINGTTITRNVRTTNVFKFDGYKEYYVEGENTIVAYDVAGNTKEFTFELDTTKPEITGISKEITNEDVTLTITDKNLKEVKVNDEVVTLTDNTYKFEKDGKYTVVATDKAGNSEEIEFEIDKTNPKITGVEKSLTKENVTLTITDKNLDKVTVNGEEKQLKDNKITLKEDNEYEVIALDKAGNSKKVEFEIDATAPTVTIQKSSVVTANNIYSKIDFSVSDKSGVPKIVINGTKITREVRTTNTFKFDGYKKYYVEGENTVVVYDVTGNTKEFKFILDITGPTITIQDSIGSNNIYSKINLAINDVPSGIEKVEVNNTVVELTNGKLLFTENLYTEGTNKVVATDNVGNTKELTFELDTTKPEITGIADKAFTNKDVTLTITDKNLKEVKVDNEAVTLKDNKYTIKATNETEGKHTVEAIDKAGNSKKIEFTIDITKPTSTITDKSYHKGDINYEIVEANFDYANVYLNHATKTTKYTKEFKLTEEGTYQLDIFDLSGNKVTKWVVIDKHLPEITASSKYTNENVTLTITDKYLLTVTINDKTYTRDNMKAKANNEDWTFTKELTEAGTYEITAVDKTGYESKETVVIDREGPVPTKVQVAGGKLIKSVVDDKKVYTHYYKENDSLIFTVEFDEELSAKPILTINDVSFGEMVLDKNTTYTYTKSVKPNGNIKIADGVVVYEITGYKDSLGNEGKKLTIDDVAEPVSKNAVVDTTAPSIEVIKNNAYSNKDVTLTITDTNLSKVTVDNEEVTLNEKNEITLSNEKPYTVVATDKAGNTTTKTFTIDKKFDGIHHSNLQAGKEVEPNVFYAKENDTIYMAIKFNEAINDENVAFKLVQGDKKITLTDVTKQIEEDGVYYYKYYKITKDEFEDGEVKMLVTGIEDLAGNTHKDVNAPSNSRRVFLDMTAPTVTDVKLTKNVSGKTNIELTFSEDIVLFNDKEVSGNKVTLTNIKNNTYNYTFTDATGNVGSYELEVKVDELANVYTINSESDLVNLANYINSGETRFANSTIKLNTDVKLRKEWNPMFATKATMDKVVIDGNGHTITHLFTLRETPEKMDGTLEKQYGNGFIGDIKDGVNVTIINIKFDNATITDPSGTGNDGTISQHYAGVVVGHNDGNLTIENVTVTNAKVNNSWQTGGLVGYSSKNLTFTDCTIKDSYIGGIQATAGTLFGLGKANITVNNSHAENVTLYTDGLTFASTQAKEDNYYVGHLYEYELTVDNLSSEKDIVIGVKTEKELLNTLNSGSANSKETIKLLDNIVLTEKLLINENTDIILDLNKKSITAYNVATKRIESYGKVVLTNGKILGGTEYDSNVSNGTAMIKLFNDAELTIESNASVAGGYSVVWPTANSKLVVKGAITSEGGAAVITNGTYIIGATITIEDGATLTSKNATAIYLPSGNLIVNGGKITGYSGIGIKGGTAIINGGEIKATGAQVAFEHEGSGWVDTGDALAVENSSYPAAPPVVTINGGKFISKYGKAIVSYVESDKFDPITGYVKGGQFNKEIDSSYIASGYTQVEDNELATKVVAE